MDFLKFGMSYEKKKKVEGDSKFFGLSGETALPQLAYLDHLTGNGKHPPSLPSLPSLLYFPHSKRPPPTAQLYGVLIAYCESLLNKM